MINKILITGNGFDVYHKLPTKYADFLRFAKLWDVFKENIRVPDEKLVDNCIDVPLGEKGELTEETMIAFATGLKFDEKEIKYLDEHLKNNVWIQLFEDTKGKNQWIDFEMEMHKKLMHISKFYNDFLPAQRDGAVAVAKKLDAKSMKKVVGEFGKIAGSDYVNYISGTASTLDWDIEKLEKQERLLVEVAKKELDVLIECLKLYLREFVSRMALHVKSKQVEEIGTCNVLNFNYTYTYHRLYKAYQREEGEYHEIHGEIKEDNMVLGIDDDAFDKNLIYIYFAKYFQRIQKRTGAYYKEWLTQETTSDEDELVELYVFGHSLGRSDKAIITELFTHPNVGKITIFYHSQTSYEELITNLVDIFEKEYVIDAVGKEKIKFVQLKEAVRL